MEKSFLIIDTQIIDFEFKAYTSLFTIDRNEKLKRKNMISSFIHIFSKYIHSVYFFFIRISHFGIFIINI